MSSFKNYWSSLKYHTVTRPSINTAVAIKNHFGKAIVNHLRKKKLLSAEAARHLHGPNKQKRGIQAAYKRKLASATKAAKLAGKASKPTPTVRTAKVAPVIRKTAPKPSPVVPKTSLSQKKHYANKSVSGALASSRTHGQLRRKLTGLAVRSFTREGNQGKNVKDVAKGIKALRKKFPGATRKIVKERKEKLMREAARKLAGQ